MPENIQPDKQDLRRYIEWSNNGNVQLELYAEFNTNKDILISHIKFLWPDFVVYEGKVFRDGFNIENYKRWKKKYNNNVEEIERVMNHIHLQEGLLQNLPESLSDKNLEYVSSMLVKMWKAALSSQFPNRSFEVIGDKQENGDYLITFWQVGPKNV